MNRFVASNGLTVREIFRGVVRVQGAFPQYLDVQADDADALREFFRAEEDERLKRWRWPENPDYVVYPRADHVAVVNEQSGNAFQATRDQAHIGTGLSSAARAYFDAHPEPKPWHDAKVGEVWVIRLRGEDEETACLVESFEDTHVFQMPDAESITTTRDIVETARRIWPEVAS